jgi:hypothetical protein
MTLQKEDANCMRNSDELLTSHSSAQTLQTVARHLLEQINN